MLNIYSGCVINIIHCQEAGNGVLLRCLPRDPARTESLCWWTASNTIDLTLFKTWALLKPAAVLAAGEGVCNSVTQFVVRLNHSRKTCRRRKHCGFRWQYRTPWAPHHQDGKCHSELICFKRELFSYLNYILWGTENLPGDVCTEMCVCPWFSGALVFCYFTICTFGARQIFGEEIKPL